MSVRVVDFLTRLHRKLSADENEVVTKLSDYLAQHKEGLISFDELWFGAYAVLESAKEIAIAAKVLGDAQEKVIAEAVAEEDAS